MKNKWKTFAIPAQWKTLRDAPGWKTLGNFEKKLLKLGWPHRFLNLSFNEIATLLGVKRNAAIRLMQKLEKLQYVTRKKEFLKKKNGDLTGIHKRNYYCFTKKGRAEIKVILNKLFEAELPNNLHNCRINKPSENSTFPAYFQIKKFLAIKKLFNKFKCMPAFHRAYRGTMLILLSGSLSRIQKILKLMRSKYDKGWKLRNFWGFFMKQFKAKGKVVGYFKFLSREYLDAVNGKDSRLNEGVDTGAVVSSIQKLQSLTSEHATEKNLSRILIHGAQKLKMALDEVCYRLNLGRAAVPMSLDEREEKREKQITRQVKVHKKTGKPYTYENHMNGEPFAIKTVPVKGQISGFLRSEKEAANTLELDKLENPAFASSSNLKNPEIKIKSWVGLLISKLERCKAL